MHKFCLLLICTLLCYSACSQDSDKPILLLNPTVYTGSGEVYENAALAFEGEDITLLADARLIRLDMSAYEVVEAYGLHVYPAGLVEVLPENPQQPLFYLPLPASGAYLLSSPKPVHQLAQIPVLGEGAKATFVVTNEKVEESSSEIRYIVVKGRLKREPNQTLRRLL